MKLSTLTGLVVVMSALGGCTSGTDAPKDVVGFTAELSVAAGEETVQCKFVAMPDDRGAMAVRTTEHTYTQGSHHFLLFRTDLTEIPTGGDVLSECDEGEVSWMRNVRGVVYAAQDEKGGFQFPDRVGMSFEPGEVMLMQSHYLNTTGSELAARIDVELELIDPAGIDEEAGIIFYYNPKISVPPMGTGSATLTCPVTSDINLAFVSSHMHKRGSGFVASTDDAAAMKALGGPLYTTQEWGEPLPRVFGEAEPLALAQGSSISYTCDFDNPDPLTVVQGPSADTNEMCMFIGMYWPRENEQFEWCYDGVTDQGGAVSAAATLGCLVGCGGADAECTAGCWENACANAPMKISQIRDCLPQCIGECVTGLDSETCAACANDLCPREYDELMAASCQ